MDIVSNRDNLAPLVERISHFAADKESQGGQLRLCSGWIQSAYFKRLFPQQVVEDCVRQKITVRVLLRIGRPTDLKISDIELFQFLQSMKSSGVDADFRYSARHHAKMYVVGDSWAMIGSFNLTSGGFGDSGNEGHNPEAGVVTETLKDVHAASELFDQMWAEASALDESLIGFVANESEDTGFWLIGVRDLPAGKFVQVKEGGAVLLGRIERSSRYRLDFFGADRESIVGNFALFEQFANPKPEKGAINPNALNGIASAGDTRRQLDVARVKTIRLVRTDEGGRHAFEPCTTPPRVGAQVLDADPEQFQAVFNPARADYAALSENRDITVSFDPAPTLSMHMAVLGATGSGKSHFIKRYISKFLVPYNQSWQGRIIVMDTHGEYGEYLKEAGVDFDTLSLRQEEGTGIETPLILSADDVADAYDVKLNRALKERIQSVLNARREPTKEEFMEEITRASADEVRIEIEDFVQRLLTGSQRDLEALQLPSELKGVAEKAWEKYARVDDIFVRKNKKVARSNVERDLLDKVLKAYSYSSTSDAAETLATRIEELGIRFKPFDFVSRLKKPGIYCLNLADVADREGRQAVVGEIMEQVFSEAKGTKDFPALFVVDEAQNYAPQGEGKSIPSKKAMTLVASEGRKFKVGLMIATQRPAYVEKDVLAQCGSQAIFRLINEMDLKQVEACVEGVSEADLAQLPNFVAGEAIFTGVGVTMPVRVKVAQE
jgi:hypothetical protein